MTSAPDPIIVYAFKLRDQPSGRWRLARWKASLEEIERLGGEVCGPPVEYRCRGNTSDFLHGVSVAASAPTDHVEIHPHWQSPPAIDSLERSLIQTFLQRYATWCIRTRRYARAQGAAALFRDLQALGLR